MQTFLTSYDLTENARRLDSRRLFKQLLEGASILEILIKKEKSKSWNWRFHPVVKMWNGFPVGLGFYLGSIWMELQTRGIAKESQVFEKVKKLIGSRAKNLPDNSPIFPPWWGRADILSGMRSRLRCKGFADLYCAAIKKHLKLQNINNLLFLTFVKYKNELTFVDVLKLAEYIQKTKVPVTEKSFYEQFSWTDNPAADYVWPEN